MDGAGREEMFYTLITLQIIAILIMFVEFAYIFSHWSSKQQSYLLLMVLFSMINTIGYTVEMMGTSKETVLSGCRIAYLGKAYVALLVFLFIANYCNVHIPKWLVAILTAFHTAVWVLVYSCQYHTLYYTKTEFVAEGLFPHVEYTHGFVYYIFIAVQASYFITSIILSLRFYKRTQIPQIKKQAGWLSAFLIVALGGNVAAMRVVSGNYDVTTLFFCVNSIVLFIIVMRYDLLKTVDLAKEYAIDNLPDGILIADDSNHLIYCNDLARDILEQNGFPRESNVIPYTLHEAENLFCADKAYQIERQHLCPATGEMVDIYLLHDITHSYFFQEKLKEEVERQTKKAEERRKQVEGMSLQTVKTLASAIDAKDPYTKGHSARVAEYATLLAKELGYEEKDLVNLHYAALLHDIGKISVPDSVLNKPSKLTDIEYNIIKSHTTVGGDILEKIESMPGIEGAARFHHERYDGRGYPEGISGEDIQEVARIISIADSYDAMNSKRVYRDSLPKEKIREELVRGKGSQFDPDMLEVFLQLFDSGALEAAEKEIADSEGAKGPDNILKRIIENVSKKDEGDRDLLTGLKLRRSGEKAICEEMKQYPGALAFIDVDNLKVINDTMGHLAGDHLIRIVGQILAGYEDKGVVSRLGGDEFLFFIRNVTQNDAIAILEKVTEKFNEEKKKDTVLRKASLSIGVCASRTTDEYQEVYLKADKALYYVKNQGKDGIHSYDREDFSKEEKKLNVDLEKLVQSLRASGTYQGAMDVEYRVFAKLYEYTKNMGERYQQSYELVMVTLDIEQEMEIDEIEKAMECMGEAIRLGIRNVDICTRYSSVQHLIILMNANPKEIQTIMDRIFNGFYKRYHGRGIHTSFHVAGNLQGEKQEN